MKTINVELKKKTIQSAYNQVKMLSDLDFPNFQKGEPLYNLIMEIKKDIKKQNKLDKMGSWKDLLEFWPLSIVIPTMLILILTANLWQ
tara:strand:+ start:293 stop:556 length:264 start_codon:yes stop_codon:yes gene_type:complete